MLLTSLFPPDNGSEFLAYFESQATHSDHQLLLILAKFLFVCFVLFVFIVLC